MPLSSFRVILAVSMMVVGMTHFTHASLFVSIMPDYLPFHLELVYLSGVFEVVLGAMLLFERTRILAAWGLIALYLAVFPANINMALHPDIQILGRPDWFPQPTPLMAWLRLPFQAGFIYWAYRYSRPARARGAHRETLSRAREQAI